MSFTYNEPTVFCEYMYDVAKLAQERGLWTYFHTNGALNPEPLRELLKHMDAGLHYVYIGNVPGHVANSTFCPQCGRTLIERVHSSVISNHIKEGRCPFCGYQIPGVWESGVKVRDEKPK